MFRIPPALWPWPWRAVRSSHLPPPPGAPPPSSAASSSSTRIPILILDRLLPHVPTSMPPSHLHSLWSCDGEIEMGTRPVDHRVSQESPTTGAG
eukprot:5238021-Pyramimonas_sp.AAC.1